LGGVDEHFGDNRRRGEALPFQGDSVVQTARRAAPSIADAGNHQIGVPVKLGQHFRLRR
jgi:hypothetical protein